MKEGGPNFDIFSSVLQFFCSRIILKRIENGKGFTGAEGMLFQTIFEKLHDVVVFLVLFEQFGQNLFEFLPQNLIVLPNKKHFVCSFLIIRA